MGIYYDYNNIMSRNCMLNFILTNRGGGKTFGFKKKAIKNFLKDGSQFAYIRRYKSHLEDMPETFFDDDIVKLFPNHEFKASKKKCYIDGKVAGFLFPLSTATSKKSNAYPRITLICFDEFIPESSSDRYISNDEPLLLDSIVETIVRLRTNCKVICLANKVNIANQYFEHYGIYPDFEDGIKVYDGLIAVELNANTEFAEEKTKTQWGKIMMRTKYGRYSIYNESLRNDNAYILSKKPSNSKFMFSFYDGINEYGVWSFSNCFYVDKKFVNTSPLRYCFTKENLKNPYRLFASFKNSALFYSFKRSFHMGNVYFKDRYIKNGFYNICKYLGIN